MHSIQETYMYFGDNHAPMTIHDNNLDGDDDDNRLSGFYLIFSFVKTYNRNAFISVGFL